jgi:hypothetical protein
MKPLSFVIILSCLFCTETYSQQTAFKSGEKLNYTLKYGFLHGGNASLYVKKIRYRKMVVFYAKAEAKSVGMTDKLYKIRDVYESYFDTGTCLPYKSIRNINEGGYHVYSDLYFKRYDSTVYSMDIGHVKVPHDVLDMVSALYYLRSLDLSTLEKGDRIEVVTFFDNEIFPFPLRYKGIETVKVKMGKIRCYRFDPVVEPGRIFESEDDMSVWISADENKVPIRVQFDLIVGSVKCDLDKYSNLSHSLKKK